MAREEIIGLTNTNWLDKRGNFPCCHIGCVNEADYIIGTHYDDYTHMCKDHKDEYALPNEIIKPIIRSVIEGKDEGS